MRRFIAVAVAVAVLAGSGGSQGVSARPILEAFVENTSLRCEVAAPGAAQTPFGIYIFVVNRAPLVPSRAARSEVPGTFIARSITSRLEHDGVPGGGRTDDLSENPWAPRADRLVLPGETAAVMYYGWICKPGTTTVEFTIHGTVDGAPVDLFTSTRVKSS